MAASGRSSKPGGPRSDSSAWNSLNTVLLLGAVLLLLRQQWQSAEKAGTRVTLPPRVGLWPPPPEYVADGGGGGTAAAEAASAAAAVAAARSEAERERQAAAKLGAELARLRAASRTAAGGGGSAAARGGGDPARLECLAEKLLDGRGVRLGILGGSVSFGTTFTTSKHLPPKPDLVVVEYAVNFDTTVDEAPTSASPLPPPPHPSPHQLLPASSSRPAQDAASFERLLRQLLKLPGAPAVLLLNTLELMVHPASWGANVQRIFFSGCDGYGCLKAPPWADSNDLAFPYEAKAEDAIVRLAGYYGSATAPSYAGGARGRVPSVSLRGALYSELKSNSTRWPLKQLFHDRHHPAAWGRSSSPPRRTWHSLMAQLVIDRIRAALDAVAARRSAGSRPQSACAAVSAEAAAGTPGPSGYPLLAPLLSPSAPVGLCLKGDELTRAMLNSSTFAYRVEGTDAKMKPGIIGTAPGEHAEFCIDVDRLGRGERFTVLLGHLVSYEHMGIARVTCEGATPPHHLAGEARGECSCPAEEVDAFVKGGQFSVFKAKVLELARARAPAAKPPPRAGCGCQLRLEILPKSGSGEFKFKEPPLKGGEGPAG
ncbi:hypothetical protein EMIHUDRAFT_113096 [Emiliania huxleyi CCMP1516]|uniref:Uncharacterized protein n=2 Tax=Emiliania huxleyi TaxID=2903 RepID=A0A0D3K4J0_EMIH1|nr:hypothetical protein EMIHUDRAFT_113096 [Emiliania huxleyi CCMP1516]EOD30675.1 hypothetical protein EMIHUDRAFT_113096 [Emiliania huxleyi CCMP1516]|eukprot:XP_005783104.1 hypothetical protein EMIHUDRAFT_113096 [Emiliania huxleyi CCMP1516]